MSNEFIREDRYIVFKLSDVERYLTDKDRANITMMKMEIDAGRDCANKPPFKGLIVEADWPEYEPTWKAIEARVTGAQPAPSVSDGWKEAAIAWEVCGSLHREYAKGKDPFFKKRQEDFVKHANDARTMLAAPEAKPCPPPK